MSVRLSPLIGEGGFRLLYARSLHLSSFKFPWLAGAPARSGSPFAELETGLKSQAPSIAAEAGGVVVATFTGLLHTLIGEGLTKRLLAPSPRDEGSTESEQEVSQ